MARAAEQNYLGARTPNLRFRARVRSFISLGVKFACVAAAYELDTERDERSNSRPESQIWSSGTQIVLFSGASHVGERRGIELQLCLTEGAERAMMKKKVEVAANVAVILFAVVIGSAFLNERVS